MHTPEKSFPQQIPQGSRHTRAKTRHVPKNIAKSQPRRSRSTSRGHLFHRLNVRFPWLKFAALLSLVALVAVDLAGFTISSLRDSDDHIKTAPMSHHPKATTRDPEGKMLVALTFDDGPMPATTPHLLDILTEKDVPATFFMLGFMARDNPDIVQRAARERHEIASHTMYHQNLVILTPAAARADLDESKATLKSIIGDRGPAYVRPPYGNYTESIAVAATRPLILWSVDTQDWQNKNTESIVNTAMSQVHDGAIILMHDIYSTSVEAVPTLVDTLRAAGYEFVTISEMAKLRGIQLNPGEAYYDLRP